MTNPIRRLLELVSRPVVFTRKLPFSAGGLPISVSPAASLTYWLGLDGRKFADLYDFSNRFARPGCQVWDVGSNLGVFAFAAVSRVLPGGHVHCFEPDPWARGLLERSRELNPAVADSLTIHPWAVTDHVGSATLCIPKRGRASSHLEEAQEGSGHAITGGVRRRIEVTARTLDCLLEILPAPQVLKIDVDGAEAAVLRGSERLLIKHRPVLLLEVFEKNSREVAEVLSCHRYDLYDYTQGESGCRMVTSPAYQTLAIPRP